jgi:TonB family protein
MKFKSAVIMSVVLHASLFALALYMPTPKSSGPVYYVDLINMPGGGGGGGGSKGQLVQQQQPRPTQRQSVKDLTVQKEEPQSKIRYPDKDVKKRSSKKNNKREKKKLVSVVKKDRSDKQQQSPSTTVTRKDRLPGNELQTGISGGGGSGGGSGGGFGTGTGTGYGPGSGIGGFPYAYYIETLRGKISSSWYSALVSPGLRGKHVAGVYFKILRNGRISDLELESKSGNNSLDLSALRAVENAAPFPPLPSDYPYSYLAVHFEFAWEKK